MNILRFSVHHPIFTTMMMLIIIILGLISLSRLPIDLMPDITYPTISISTSYGNVGPEEIEQLITRPIEEAMSAVAGVQELTSTSSQGQSSVRVSFAWGTDLNEATNDIRDRLDRVIARLPDEADRPSLRKFDPSAMPILMMGAAGKLDPIELRNLIEDQVKNRIERIPGVAALSINGGLTREIQVNFRPADINALGLALDQVINAIRAANQNIPGGTIEQGNLEVKVRTPGEYTNIAELENTIVATRAGTPIRLREIASVVDTTSRQTSIIRINGVPGMYLAVSKQSGTNTVQVAQDVLREIELVNRDLPQIQITPVVDSSLYIQRSIANVADSALYGGLLAVLALFFFLRNLPSTLVITTAIPIAVIATFALLYFNGFTLNIMTLGGLALGVGMMVDCSIVVLENITRFREEGLDPVQAAIAGSEEVAAAIIAGTLTSLVVFLPMIFIRGMVGVMFKQLAYVVSFSQIGSLFVALTLVPMLSAHLHKPIALNNGDKRHHRIYRFSERLFRQVEDGYAHILEIALNHRVVVVLGSALLVGGSLLLIPLLGFELMPATDEGDVRITIQPETGTRLDLFETMMRPIEAQVIQAVPETEKWLTSIGASWGGGARSGDLRLTLKPVKTRVRSSEAIAMAVRQQLTGIPGIEVRARAGQGMMMMRGLGSSGGERIEIEVQGYDLVTADALAQQLKRLAMQVEGVTDVRISRESGSPENVIVIDRAKAADLQLNVAQIATMLKTVLQGTTATYFRTGGNEYPIVVRLKDAEKMRMADVLNLTVTNAAGQPIVLRNVAREETSVGPASIERKNQERLITVSLNISGRDTGHIVADMREQIKTLPIPRDFSINFGGDVEEQQKSFNELLTSLILSLVLVYMVMACLYESLRDPLVVMFSVPLAIIGVVLALFLTHTTFNIQSFIGCIMLGGIVVNNAILLVDHTNQLRARGVPVREAIADAGRHRLRPILMTSLTSVLGLLPLALGIGEGSEAQAPLAITVIGGLTSSTLITLIFIPIVYSIFEARLNVKKRPEGR